MTTSRSRSRARSQLTPPTAVGTRLAGDDAFWQAVMERGRAVDDDFVFAVTTTGIYCRPSCPARRPHRRNARFFATPAKAEAAGFRACKRCNPARRPDGTTPDRRTVAVAHGCHLIETAEPMPTLKALAHSCGLSPAQFHRNFKSIIGITPKAYADGLRAGRLRAVLPQSTTITAAIYQAGFSAPSRFYAAAQGILGMAPKSFRAGGRGERIAHIIAQSSLGLVLMAFSAKGLCAVLLGEDRDELRADLRRRFAQAEHVEGDDELAAFAAEVIARIDDPAAPSATAGSTLPLDLRGTAFQLRVWEALRRIPPGQTLSYSQLAQNIGAPRAVRAVARACGANPLAVVVPCHRVVAAAGNLTGYRWEIKRKKALLAKEAKPCGAAPAAVRPVSQRKPHRP